MGDTRADVLPTDDVMAVPAILASHLDSVQDKFDNEEKNAWDDAIEEKVKSSAYPDLDRSPKKNWVEKAGGLPKYIERIAKHLHYEQGMTIGHAIAAAIETCRRWAAGGGDVKPDTVAKAQAALAEWEAKKGKNRAKDVAKDATKGLMDNNESGEYTEAQFAGIEYKNVGVKGLRVANESTGVVEAIVSVTGIVDEVKDIIKPGAYAKTLAKRTPKGVFSHAWDQPIAKTLDIKELLPGDPRLPKKTAKGDPWPAGAGALWVKMQFNLDGERGRQAFSDVKFYGDDQEWSIGYNVPVGGAKVNTKTGQREIDTLDLFEYSPVLFGAMPLAATASVKSAQEAYRAMTGRGQWTVPDHAVETDEEKATEVPDETTDAAGVEVDEVATNSTDPETVVNDTDGADDVGMYSMDADGNLTEIEVDEDAFDGDEEYTPIEGEDTGSIKDLMGPDDLHLLRKALAALDELLSGNEVPDLESKAARSQVPGDQIDGDSDTDGDTNEGSIADAVEKWVPDADEELTAAAEALDEALGATDADAADSAANDLLDLLEARMDEADDTDGLSRVAQMVADALDAADSKNPPSENNSEGKVLDQFTDDTEIEDGEDDFEASAFLDELKSFLD